MTENEMVGVMRQLIVLKSDLEKIAHLQVDNTSKNFTLLSQSVNDAQQKMDSMLKDAGTVLQKEANQTFTIVTETRFTALEQRINQLCEKVDRTTNRIEAVSHAASKQTKLSGWTVLCGSVLTGIVIIGAAVWYGWGAKQKADALLDYNNRIEFNINVKELIKGAELTACDGELCYKAPKEVTRYDKNDDYIIIKKAVK